MINSVQKLYLYQLIQLTGSFIPLASTHKQQKKHIERIKNITEECDNALNAAKDVVNLRLDEKIQTLKTKSATLKTQIDKLSGGDQQIHLINEMQEEKDNLNISIHEQTKIKEKQNIYYKQRYNQAVKRTAKSLIDDNRIKKRKLGAGPKEKIDEEDEDFLLNCIEFKATAHGRRHDSESKPLSLVQLCTIGVDLKILEPCKLRSIKANGYSHLKKPTKSEEKNRIHTKHQRAHVKRAVIHLCKEDQDLALIHSMDDKAYLKPEASDGLDKFKVFQTTDSDKQRRLPKYDFAQAKLNITPSSHRFIMKDITYVDNNLEMVMSEDENI
ncbi:CGNL1 [Mytilus coruscus]|uniref:CGNL1 n=1 Tax=Mytilus coruscus TaxID=42192 RepID=A0A6J7ZTM3_MYTCO|nr:CGNL1 [Mytilus coruscus]